MPQLIQQVSLNTQGRDFIVGDIHGAFSKLKQQLTLLQFNPEVDRLFSVGDMVDRGAESHKVLKWLKKPWFYAVRGNHEQLVIESFLHAGHARTHHQSHGGAWFYREPYERRAKYVQALSQLPLIIELETPHGLVGIVHANCPTNNWTELNQKLRSDLPKEHLVESCQWSRSRVRGQDTSRVDGIYMVVIGHTVVPQQLQLGNVLCIETAGWRDEGNFTLLEVNNAKSSPLQASSSAKALCST